MMNMQGSTLMHPNTMMPPPPQQQLHQPNMMLNQHPIVATTTPRPEDAARHITVSNPVQHSDGLNKYTTYDVIVHPIHYNNSNIDGGGGGGLIIPPQQQSTLPTSVVSRRYSDFVWLYDRFHIDRPGAIVPPLPEKQPVGRFTPSFIEERRYQLERFVRRVVLHPELYDCPCLDTFLTASDSAFQMAKQNKGTAAVPTSNMSASTMNGSFMQQPGQQQHPYGGQSILVGGSNTNTGSNDGIKRWFAEKKTSLAGDLVKSPDDDLFDEISRYITGLDTQMRTVSQQATGLVRKGKEIANGLFEFGLAFNLLGQSEADVLGGALLCMGDTADKLSVLAAEQAERELLQFEEPLQDYIKTIHAVQLALKRRQDKRITYSTCLSDTESKQNQFYKLRSQLGSEKRAYEVEMSVRRAQEAADMARDEFVSCSQRVLREVDRFKREKAESMRRTVLDYITIQVEYNKRMEDIWSALIPELEKVPPMVDQNTNNISSSMMQNSPQISDNTILQPQPALYYGQPPPPVPQPFDPTAQQQQQQVPPPSIVPSQQQHQPMMNNDPSSMISVQYRETPGL